MKFSVIVPVYNVEKYLDRCIQSIIDQTYTDFELILVDDGSPDNCPKMCDEWAKRDARINVIHKKNGGRLHARLSGIKEAQGEYIISVDSDDFIDKNLLKVCYLNLFDIPDCLIFDFVNSIEYKNNEEELSNHLEKEAVLNTESDRLKYYLDNIICSFNGGWEICRRCIKKELIDISYLQSLPKINFAEDFLLTATIMPRLSKIKKLGFKGYYYIANEESIMLSTKLKFFINEVNELLLILQKYYTENKYNYFLKSIYNMHYVISISSLAYGVCVPNEKEIITKELQTKIENYTIANMGFYKQNVKKYNKTKISKRIKYNECRPNEYWTIKYKTLILSYFINKSKLKLKISFKLAKVKVFFIVLNRRVIRGIKKLLKKY